MAGIWRICGQDKGFSDRGMVMGIVNVTPDSFSDGGKYLDTDLAVELGLRHVAEGAEILDVGGESTRPGAEAVDAEEEMRRVLPVIRALRAQTSVLISIDTMKASVAAVVAKASNPARCVSPGSDSPKIPS